MKLLLGVLALAIGAGAQPLSLGLKAGFAATGDLDRSWATSESKRPLYGVMGVFRIGRGFSVEVDGLYQRVGYRVESSFFDLESTFTQARGNAWSFPVLLRKSTGRGVYFAGGYAPRAIHGNEKVTIVQATTLDATSYQIYHSEYPGEWQTSHGVVAGAGVERRAGRLRIGPEVRYTYWATPALDVQGSRGFSIQSQRHQVEVFLGVRFP